ncbi:uncharacterized protein FA14DRAFT_21892 [Meira miltonrushii]|uniref:Uncharacterized protein n=1 Tax=Meira miltonrushii TaxID=1280837 RepID=A0A316VLP2_9BASI|nr:uncharacterized protein FA14DRAFT_21892 [Meira miltonrushii]PWN37998.1 hypothetical protein FA14DRAFT_21892 [Meira miltonrushii]
MNTNHDSGAASTSSAGSFSMMPAMQSSVSEDNLYSAGSMFMSRPDQYGNLSSLTPIVNPADQPLQPATNAEDQFGQSNINPHIDGQEEAFELTEEQRRRSIEQKKIWKRTTNSDAAIARFFARVVAAREGEIENNDVPVCGPGGYNIPAWSQNTNLSLAQDTSIASSSASSWSGQEISGMTGSIVGATSDGQMTGSTDLTGNAAQMSQSNAHTPESGGPARRGSGLSHLSQASMLPLSANNTPPSDTVGFRNQRPPPLQFDSLPTFAQQHNLAQLTQDRGSANTFVESPMTTIQGSGTNMSTSFSQQRMQPSVLTPLSGSGSVPLRSPSFINPNSSPGLHSTANVQQDLTSMSRPFQTPVTELSSHLFALGHSRGPSEGSSEEKDVFNDPQQ